MIFLHQCPGHGAVMFCLWPCPEPADSSKSWCSLNQALTNWHLGLSQMIQLLAVGIFLPVSNTGPCTHLQWMQAQPLPWAFGQPCPAAMHSSWAWGVFSLISKDSSFLGCPCSGMAGISFLEFYLLQHMPKVTALPVAGTSAERAGRMQDLVSRPHCVTFARPGLFLGPTISYRQDSCRVLTKVATSAVYLCSFKSTRGTNALGMSWHFWETSSVTGITPEEAGNFQSLPSGTGAPVTKFAGHCHTNMWGSTCISKITISYWMGWDHMDNPWRGRIQNSACQWVFSLEMQFPRPGGCVTAAWCPCDSPKAMGHPTHAGVTQLSQLPPCTH